MIAEFPGVVGDIDLYMMVMRAICGDTEGKSMIDLCCAFAPNTPKLGFSRRAYVDVIDRKLDHVEEQQYFEVGNALEMDDIIHYYDVAICSDGIEHMEVSDGYKLLSIMEAISDKQILFTPLGNILGLAEHDNKDPEAHRSLWYPSMFHGYACLVYPDYHKIWNGGAVWAWKCEDIEKDFERVIKMIGNG